MSYSSPLIPITKLSSQVVVVQASNSSTWQVEAGTLSSRPAQLIANSRIAKATQRLF